MAVGSDTRLALMGRLQASGAEVVVLVAPAGYGKSTVARDLGGRRDRHATCFSASDPYVFGRRILEALQTESPERRLRIAESIASSGDAPQPAMVLDFWSAPLEAESAIVLENLEEAIDSAPSVHFLTELIRQRPRGRRLILCSRRDLPQALLRYLAPDSTEFVDALSLALNREEVDSLLAGLELSSEIGETIQKLTDGWPIAVMLMVRMAREGRFDHRSSATDARYDHLLDHLSREYILGLPQTFLDALLISAGVTGATVDDAARWLEVDAHGLRDFLRTCPFVRVLEDVLVPHPLLVALGQTRFAAETASFVNSAIAEYREHGLLLRSAALEIGRNNFDRAAGDLSRHTVASGTCGLGESQAFVNLVALLGKDCWLTYPALWLAMLQLRRFAMPGDDLIAEAYRVYSTLRPTDNERLRAHVAECLATILINYGRGEEVSPLLDDCLGYITDSSLARRLEIDRLGAKTHTGAYLVAQKAFRAAADSSVGNPAFYGPKLDFIEATIALRRGAYERGVALLEESVRISRQSGLTSSLQVTLSNLILESWLAGDDVRFQTALAELKSTLIPGLDKPWTFLIDAATKPHEAVATGYEFPSVRCVAHLMIATASDRSNGPKHAVSAIHEADKSADIAVRIIARIASAEIVAASRPVALAEAAELAQAVDIVELRESISAFERGSDAGVFEPFVNLRLRHTRRVVPVTIRLASFDALLDGQPATLATVEFALTAYLAAARRAVPRETLCDALWPESDIDSSARNLKVYIHRIRKKLGSDIIALVGETYIIGSHVTLDLHVAEATIRALRHGGLSAARVSGLRRIIAAFATSHSTRLERYEWYGDLARRSRDVARSAALALAREIHHSDSIEARLLQNIFEEDVCDDEVCEALIGTYLAEHQLADVRATLSKFVAAAARDGDALAISRGRELQQSLAGHVDFAVKS